MIGCHTAVIGLLYPYLDDILGERRGRKQEWSSVMRCIAVFVGINHASAVSFASFTSHSFKQLRACTAESIQLLVFGTA